MILEPLVFLAAGGTPLVLSQTRQHSPWTDPRARDMAFYGALGLGLASALTGSTTLGAAALGAGGAWALMKGDDLIRRLP